MFAGSEPVRLITPQHVRLILRIACAAVLIAVLTQTRADPDLFGHVRFGHDIVAARSVHLDDRYSFTSDRPWINHEWLSEVAMYGVYNAGGAAGLIALKLSLLALMLGAVTLMSRRHGLPDAAQDFLLGFAVICTFPQGHPIRPQLFSLALFAWLLFVLSCARRNRRVLLWSIPIMAMWVNLHGGWLVGAGTLVVWTGVDLCSGRPLRDKAIAIGVALAATAVTLANPYGLQMWRFLQETVGLGREAVTEWQPVFHVGVLFGLWAMVAALAIAGLVIAVTRRAIDLPESVVVLMLAVGSFRVSRLLAFFAISAVMLLGPEIGGLFHRRAPSESRGTTVRWAPAAVLAFALVLAGMAVRVSARNASCIRIEDSVFPEAEAASVLTGLGARGRMLTYFDYGEYAIWYLSPDIRVSIDGRRETVYSDSAIQRQLRFYYEPSDRREIVKTLQPDYIWMPSSLEVTKDLAADGWKPVFSGPRTVILARGNVQERPYSSNRVASRCFPGP